MLELYRVVRRGKVYYGESEHEDPFLLGCLGFGLGVFGHGDLPRVGSFLGFDYLRCL